MMSQVAHLPYVIYVLRLWLSSEEEIVWYFSLEDPRTGARRGFASLDEMVFFLRRETGLNAWDAPERGRTDG